jgi:outer membrane protein TolC
MNAGLALAVLAVPLLSGCASHDFGGSIAQVNRETAAFSGGRLAMVGSAEQQAAMRKEADQLLDGALGMDHAVAVALLNSPGVQALLAEYAGEAARAAQSGRVANPQLVFERLAGSAEIEFTRTLAFGLLDLITLPQRAAVAERRIEQTRLMLATAVVDQVTEVRTAWVKAVAAEELRRYAAQVRRAAQVSADLARRMQQVGNFTRLQRARQHAFYADAVAQLAAAEQHRVAAREALVRLLGLSEGQAARLRLPERLPDLPVAPRTAEAVAAAASRARLDLRLAEHALAIARREAGMAALTSLTDIELTLIRETKFERDHGEQARARGYEIAVRLPVFDWGELTREARRADALAATHRLEATARSAASQLREAYAGYRTHYDLARHYRDEIVPLRKAISDENLLRYNGMFISVFELIADMREQIAGVMASINAQQQFWLAHAALEATLVGRPVANPPAMAAATPAMAGEGGH